VNLDDHVVALGRIRQQFTVGIIKPAIPSDDIETSAALHGIARIRGKIDQRRFQLRPVHDDWPKVIARCQFQIDIVT
jgi:hypothetical protein